MLPLTPEQQERYSRQTRLPQIGEEGQQRLLASRVLVIGVGGLGSPVLLYLAAAGVGHLVISDYDQVELSNLQRQVIHQTDSVGELKVDSAKQRITATNPDCRVDAITHELEGEELQRQIAQADVVVDCSDNFPTRFNINRYCVAASTPLVSGAAIRLEGQVATYHPANGGPCYQCLYKQNYENMATCEMEGVAGPVVGIIGTMQALQVIQLITGKGDQLPGKLLLFDGETMTWQSINIPKNPTCPVCAS